MSNTAQKPAEETDAAYHARIKEAAHKVMDLFGSDETENPSYVVGFELGFMKAFHTLNTSCDVCFPRDEDDQPFNDGFRDALGHLGCTWLDDYER